MKLLMTNKSDMQSGDFTITNNSNDIWAVEDGELEELHLDNILEYVNPKDLTNYVTLASKKVMLNGLLCITGNHIFNVANQLVLDIINMDEFNKLILSGRQCVVDPSELMTLINRLGFNIVEMRYLNESFILKAKRNAN